MEATLAIFTFILLSLSALCFYRWSERNLLSLAFSLLTFLLAIWCALLALSEIPFPKPVQTFLVNIIPVPINCIPILLTYIIFNYTRPYSLIWPPALLITFHAVAILFFSWYAFKGVVGPYQMKEGLKVFHPGSLYYPACAYIYISIFACAAVLARNIFKGNYFVRLHSIYLFTGVMLGGIVSAVFVIVLPLCGISLTSMAVLGIIAFLWFAWIPITKYRLFNIELTDFKCDFRSPRLSSAIVSVNRYLLNTMDPKAFKEICDQFEVKRQDEIYALQAEMLLEVSYGKEGGVSNHVRKYAKKVSNLFLS
ncbi:putative membrane protein [Leptospira broomii serovar Hurstbridge str. 5399]|uniref:Membrane protein n=1 Tax=Leptospira broomii serovar Hurstbridge str. 5399 TaxID=1049789 RepID=T0GEF1_9LEPT|nr:histidine kinase N-terminal 7TM domain-containing protein [Leptospira broomii]EQA43783.1 putative membrane protein [Leptospira broomii serovar Hurstbridge str. 5399]